MVRGEMEEGVIFDIKRFAIHDGPGIRTTVFFKGCPLRCGWCHNPESQGAEPELVVRPSRCQRCSSCLRVCPERALSFSGEGISVDRSRCTRCGTCARACPSQALEIVGRAVTVGETVGEIVRDVPFYDESGGGATFSGGEPLWQPDFLAAVLRACHERGIHTAVDTCGFAPWETIARVREATDLFLYDLKLMDSGRHAELTGVPNALILENLERLSRLGQTLIVRVAVIPGINDSERELRALGEFVGSLRNPPPIDLLPYHRIGVGKYTRLGRLYHLGEVTPPSEERMAQIVRLFRRYEFPVTVGGEALGDH
jgi:pyruvate formate lyase activating enzyme